MQQVDWESDIGQQVRVYRNLNNGLISLQHYIKGTGWRLSGHLENCVLQDVSFKVYEVSRQKVLLTRRRNVHAYAIGRLIGENPIDIFAPVSLAYNPYKYGHFFDRDTGEKIETASYLIVRDNQVFVRLSAQTSHKSNVIQMALDLFSDTTQPICYAVA